MPISEIQRAEWQAGIEERRKQIEVLREQSVAILHDLATAGYHGRTVSELGKPPYDRAFPIFVKHLRLGYPEEIRANMYGWFSDKAGRPYWPTLVEFYRNESSELAREALASAMSWHVVGKNVSVAIELAKDRKLGPSRQWFLYALRNKRDERTKECLASLRDDPELQSMFALIDEAKQKGTK